MKYFIWFLGLVPIMAYSELPDVHKAWEAYLEKDYFVAAKEVDQILASQITFKNNSILINELSSNDLLYLNMLQALSNYQDDNIDGFKENIKIINVLAKQEFYKRWTKQ